MNKNLNIEDKIRASHSQRISNSTKVAAAARQFSREGDYWLKKMSGDLVKSSFPYDYHIKDPVVSQDIVIENKMEFNIKDETFLHLMRLTSRSDPKLHIVLIASLAILLHHHTGFKDIILGTSIYKQKIKGDFVNTVLALRTQIKSHMTFKDFLMQVKQTYIEAFDNQNYPIEALLYKINQTSSQIGFPLFDISVLLENIHDKDYISHIKTNMAFSFLRKENNIKGLIKYNALLYKRSTIKRILDRFLHLLQEILMNSNTRLSLINILPGNEKKQLLNNFNNTSGSCFGQRKHGKNKTISQLFVEQSIKTPSHIAVVFKKTESTSPKVLTYRELNKKTDQLAKLLRKKGVRSDSITGIICQPSNQMIIAIIGVLKAGGAYLPIDPGYPEKRIKYMLKDSNTKLLLADKTISNHFDFDGQTIDLDESLTYKENKIEITMNENPKDLVYMIYTSGTTGNPKGVLVENKNLVNYLNWFSKIAKLTVKDKTILTSSFAFDLGYTSIYTSILKGGELHLLLRDFYLDPELLIKYIRDNEISYLKITPSFFSIIVNQSVFSLKNCLALRLVVLGGEPINAKDVKKAQDICQHLKIMNHYGPTETTIGSVAQMVDSSNWEEYSEHPTIGIGKPINSNRAYILGKDLNLLPVGIKGELCISGENVTRGYLNQPDLTKEKFPENTYEKGKTLYRIGDIAKWMSNGTLEFHGRLDQQVKVRGFRIELGEIERVLLTHNKVKKAVLMVKKDISNNNYLCAYFEAQTRAKSEPPITEHDLREFLSNALPDYMIPAYFVEMNEIPLTPNGKIDRNRLPEPKLKDCRSNTPPGNEIEKKMRSIWAEVLGVQENSIGIHSDFFELGGHSLMATILIAKLRKQLSVNIPLAEIFKTPSIHELSKYIIESEKNIFSIQDDNPVLLSKGKTSAKHVFMVHAGSGVVSGYMEASNMLTPRFNYWGIEADQIKHYSPRNLSNEEVAAGYIKKIQRIQPCGPYYLAGWCIGGTIAFEMANQLEQTGETVGLLVLLNSYAPEKNLLSMDVVDFSRDAELEWVKMNFPENQLKEELINTTTDEQIWPLIIKFLEKNNYDKQTIMNLFATLLKHERAIDREPIPNFDQLDVRELIYFFNVIRTYRKVRAAYIPSKKIQTQPHFISASQSIIKNRENWNQYSEIPVKFYQVNGTHFSIWEKPNVVELIELFNQILNQKKA